METKKNPKADLTRKTGFFFSIASLITMSLVLFAFEVKQYEEPIADIVQRRTNGFEEMDDVLRTEVIPPKPPPVVAPIIVEVPEEEEPEEDIRFVLDLETSTDAPIEPFVVNNEEPEEPTDVPFRIVQESAAPIGGMSAFYRYLSENIKYPTQAIRQGTEGKVFVEFVVNRDGSITEARVIKGIGSGCDEEAVRVVQNSPAWSPGKQRGKPVRQKLVATVTFKVGR